MTGNKRAGKSKLTYYIKLCQDAKCDRSARVTSPRHRIRADPISIYNRTMIAPPTDLMSLSDFSDSTKKRELIKFQLKALAAENLPRQ